MQVNDIDFADLFIQQGQRRRRAESLVLDVALRMKSLSRFGQGVPTEDTCSHFHSFSRPSLRIACFLVPYGGGIRVAAVDFAARVTARGVWRQRQEGDTLTQKGQKVLEKTMTLFSLMALSTISW